MAGRGCTVCVQITRVQEEQEVETDEITLPVALHSPLLVLKELLQDISHIEVSNQVLILCDLSDPDRNNDIHLDSTKDEMTLFQCGVTQGSVLGLHALGVNTSHVEHFSDYHKNNQSARSGVGDPRLLHTISTDITPDQANHSYNGIIFNVYCKSPYELDISSVSVGGMLGRVRVFYKYGSWLKSEDDEDDDDSDTPQRWWGASERVSRRGWEVAADSICTPSWDEPREVMFRKKIRMLPGQIVALYLHSGLPDDLGIQYQTYDRNEIVAEDDHIALMPGLGHTGSEPFDEVSGWYRAYRGLAGALSYRCSRKGWTIWDHNQFPQKFRESVLTILLCREQSLNLMDYERQQLIASRWNGTAALAIGTSSRDNILRVDRSRQLGLLHTHILYYIMEFMHWDWFPHNEDEGSILMAQDESREQSSAQSQVSALRNYLARITHSIAAAEGDAGTQATLQAGLGQLYAALMLNAQYNDGDNAYLDQDNFVEEDEEGESMSEGNIYENSDEAEDDSSDMATGSEGNAEELSEGDSSS